MRAEPWMDKTLEQVAAERRAGKRAYIIGQLLEVWPEMSDEVRAHLLEEQKRARFLSEH